MTNGASLRVLVLRLVYGGKKGRAAAKRLARLANAARRGPHVWVGVLMPTAYVWPSGQQ